MNLRIGVAAVLVATLLVLPLPGCGGPCVRHGVILRGDWSLELNRVPWIEGRHASEQESSDQTCSPPTCTGISATPNLNDGQVAKSDSPPHCDATAHCHEPRCPTPEPPVVPATYQSRPRFHPVPTRPSVLGQPISNAPPAPLPDEDWWEPGMQSPPSPLPHQARPLENSQGSPAAASRDIAHRLKSRITTMSEMAEPRSSWIFSPAVEPPGRLLAHLAARGPEAAGPR